MGYFASRAAALGPVGPELVTALFFGFAPGMVARAIPDAWRLADRGAVLTTRQRVAVEALHAVLEGADVGDADARGAERLRTLSDLTGRMVAAAPRAGRPLFAAHAALPRPEEPIARLWFDATALREFRGD